MKDLEYYSALPYRAGATPVVDERGDRHWRAWIEEIPGLEGIGESEEEALADLRERFVDYVCLRIDLGLDIPEPCA